MGNACHGCGGRIRPGRALDIVRGKRVRRHLTLIQSHFPEWLHVRCLPARKLGFLPITTVPLVGDHALTSG